VTDAVTPLDVQRMFIGAHPPLFLLEIVIRILLVYGFAAVVLRWMGKRGRRAFSPFELLVVIALGSATGDSMFYPEIPILHAWVVIAAVVTFDVGLGHLQFRSSRAQRFIESTPRVVIREGRVDHDALRAERLRLDELYSMLREHGIASTGEVRYALLELSGELGLVRYPEGHGAPGDSTLRTPALQKQGVEA
jgi:uncharacterized membrane protein YcaP (DUF421 family)